jgi:hypothetical protein
MLRPLCCLLTAALLLSADGLPALETALSAAESRSRIDAERIAAWLELGASGKAEVETAAQALATATAAPAEDSPAGQLAAARQARDAAATALAEASPRLAGERRRLAELDARIAALAAVGPAITDQALDQLAAARLDRNACERRIRACERALWLRREVLPLYRAADALYQARRKASGDGDAAKQAREALAAARATALADDPRLAALRAAAETSTKAAADAAAALAAARAPLLAGRSSEFAVELPPAANGKTQRISASLWVPDGLARVRGLVIGHPPMIGASLTRDPHLRLAARDAGLAVIACEFDGLFSYDKDGPRRLGLLLDGLAERSGLAELPRLPFLAIGHSTSGIFARNLAAWAPERAIGILHIKSGNLHQHRPEPWRGYAGIPFLAVNGEFEEFGPEGGMKGGIQPAYGAQTQWLLIREQLHRLQRADPGHRVALAVDPGGSHTSWSSELSRMAAAFVAGAAALRLPPADAPPGTPCRPLAAGDGWLLDPALDDPRHPAAPSADYAGDRATAFWVPDGATAAAITALHAGRLLLDDPTRATPVPASWPPGLIP